MRLITLPLIALMLATPAWASPKGCPPGLAKKSPPCVPPGLAKKSRNSEDRGYRIGDIVEIGDYVLLRNPERYGLDPLETYYRIDDQLFQVDRETREIIDLIGAIAAIID
ncbi:excinuclease ABC subunit A [Primorskyibacter aestuariivivens]|uniref:excinuclease ABC subunit A n=1 Tax=Primorskyibacter aestuariivivens TaxID=1888912 RepID=UPI002301FBDD|nr:excinuclease ABC subunit A [Primorskyibacter aestuariivivens]MDA7426877.1 excinuclease ABC subunit A [Primorskyibacter aestuariivivens]